jgi:putative MATE family efflux protein
MKDLTKGKESRLILQFALPMLWGNVFQQLYNIVDSIVVGHFIGKQALAAVGASFPMIFVLISMAIGYGIGASIMISQYYGAGDLTRIRKTIDTLFIFLFFASLFVSLVGICLSGPIFKMIDLPPEVIPSAKLYLNIYLAGIVFSFGFNGISSVLRGLGDSKTPLYFLVFSTVLNVLLDVLLVVVFRWGIAGVAIATVISMAATLIGAVIYLNKTHKLVRLSVLRLEFDREIFYKSLKIGIPSGLQQTFVALGMLAVFWIVNQFGTDVVAAYSAAMRIDSMVSMPAMNFAAALMSFVGQNLGANKPERVREGLKATFWMTSLISLGVTLLVVLFSRPLMGAFTDDSKVVEAGASYLVIVSSFYLIFSTMFVVNGVMRGAGDTLIPMFITLLSLWVVRLPVSYFLSVKIGETGIWWGIPIGWAVGLTCSYFYYLSGRWKRHVIIKPEMAQPTQDAP